MKAVVATFNQEKALVGAFSVIVQLNRLIGYSTSTNPPLIGQAARVPLLAAAQLRHGDQDGPHGAAQLPAGVPGWRGPQGVTGVWGVQLYIVISTACIESGVASIQSIPLLTLVL